MMGVAGGGGFGMAAAAAALARSTVAHDAGGEGGRGTTMIVNALIDVGGAGRWRCCRYAPETTAGNGSSFGEKRDVARRGGGRGDKGRQQDRASRGNEIALPRGELDIFDDRGPDPPLGRGVRWRCPAAEAAATWMRRKRGGWLAPYYCWGRGRRRCGCHRPPLVVGTDPVF